MTEIFSAGGPAILSASTVDFSEVSLDDYQISLRGVKVGQNTDFPLVTEISSSAPTAVSSVKAYGQYASHIDAVAPSRVTTFSVRVSASSQEEFSTKIERVVRAYSDLEVGVVSLKLPGIAGGRQVSSHVISTIDTSKVDKNWTYSHTDIPITFYHVDSRWIASAYQEVTFELAEETKEITVAGNVEASYFLYKGGTSSDVPDFLVVSSSNGESIIVDTDNGSGYAFFRISGDDYQAVSFPDPGTEPSSLERQPLSVDYGGEFPVLHDAGSVAITVKQIGSVVPVVLRWYASWRL